MAEMVDVHTTPFLGLQLRRLPDTACLTWDSFFDPDHTAVYRDFAIYPELLPVDEMLLSISSASETWPCLTLARLLDPSSQ